MDQSDDEYDGEENIDELEAALEDTDSEDEIMDRYYIEVLMPEGFFNQRVPRNTSRLPGSDWVAELIHGTDGRFYDNVRLPKLIFFDLVKLLVNRRLLPETSRTRVSAIEAVIMFMRTVGMHLRQRDSEERFQYSTSTINRHIRRVANALNALAPELIRVNDYTVVHPRITHDPNSYPFFEGAVGALDGTLTPAHVPMRHQAAYRSRKGAVAQNVLAICDFDMKFNYVLAGWEGSASDAHVLQHAVRNDEGFPWPPDGRYYLVDAGYTNYDKFLAPYRNTRYHLPEFNGRVAACTPKGLFNHRHASLRNSVERAFGVLKSRFAMLRYGMPSYKIENQIKITLAACVVYNFVLDSIHSDPLVEGGHPHYEVDQLIFSARDYPNTINIREQGIRRQAIAEALWEYQHQ